MYNFSETLEKLQVLISVPASGKFYQLPPDKENTVTAVNNTAAIKTAMATEVYKVCMWYSNPSQANPPFFQHNRTAFSSSTDTLI